MRGPTLASLLYVSAILSPAILSGCDRSQANAVREAGKLLDEDVLCSGDSDGCTGGGLGFTCVGRHTGREVYCSSDDTGRCVIVQGIRFTRPQAERSCATTATGEICR